MTVKCNVYGSLRYPSHRFRSALVFFIRFITNKTSYNNRLVFSPRNSPLHPFLAFALGYERVHLLVGFPKMFRFAVNFRSRPSY